MKITLKKGQNIFFTSDTHYNHTNICRGVSSWEEGRGTRDFATLKEMNEVIVNNINEMVGENDVLVHLGDWSFGGFESIIEFRYRINCKNIFLFLGNHDHHILSNRGGVKSHFLQVEKLDTLEIRRPNGDRTEKFKFECCHFPIASWNGMGRRVIHLHGHVHLNPDLKIHDGRSMDVGMDGNGMKPYSLDEIMRIMKDRPVKTLTLPKDHHEETEG